MSIITCLLVAVIANTSGHTFRAWQYAFFLYHFISSLATSAVRKQDY